MLTILGGESYGRLTIVSEAERLISGGQSKRQFLCRCECGNTVTAQLTHLRTGHTVSCGCHRKNQLGESRRTHGKAGSRTYRIWSDMNSRCYTPSSTGYKFYGGRGIRVCRRWKKSFLAFVADMGECPEGMTIDRYPDQNGDYKPSNCRWATMAQQQRNRRSNRLITHDGRTQCLAAWAEETGLPKSTIRNRLLLGWTVERTMTTPRKR